MSIESTIIESFGRSLRLFSDLIDSFDDSSLGLRLPNLSSNTIGDQLWCVVGARESFSKAIHANKWIDFSCSLKSTTDKDAVAASLRNSADAVLDVLNTINTYSDIQNRLIVDLLEHECAHHGQLIRYLYGLKLTIPESWKSRYALN